MDSEHNETLLPSFYSVSLKEIIKKRSVFRLISRKFFRIRSNKMDKKFQRWDSSNQKRIKL